MVVVEGNALERRLRGNPVAPILIRVSEGQLLPGSTLDLAVQMLLIVFAVCAVPHLPSVYHCTCGRQLDPLQSLLLQRLQSRVAEYTVLGLAVFKYFYLLRSFFFLTGLTDLPEVIRLKGREAVQIKPSMT